MKTKMKQPGPQHQAFRDDLLASMNKHAGALDSSEILALAAYTTGQIMAMMDARVWTPAKAMEIVSRNIEAGNAQAIADAIKWMPSA
jgi:hypothetical protein